MKALYLLLFLSSLYSCKSPLKETIAKRNKTTYWVCLEKEIKNHNSYAELKSFEQYLETVGILDPKNTHSFEKFFYTFIDSSYETHSILEEYNYHLLYEMEIIIPDSCKFNMSEKNQCIIDSLNLYMQEESFEQMFILSRKILLNLEKETFVSKGFQLNFLNQLYKKYQYAKIEKITTINLFVTVDSLFIEEEYTTFTQLKEHFNHQAKQKKEVLKKYGFENRASIKMHVNPEVKMGRVQDIQAILQEVTY